MQTIHLPHLWSPRPYQQPVWDFMLRGIARGMETGFREMGPRAVCVWHRRAGKDRLALNVAAMASQMRPGKYVHVLPTYRQARKVIWEGQTREGDRMLDAFPTPLHARPPRDEGMTLWLRVPSERERFRALDLPAPPNASTTPDLSMWQAIGSDRYDSLRGGNYVGVVFSEYAWQDPMAWQVVSPILAENGGWAMFISTPNGRNHFHTLRESAAADPAWFSDVRTVDQTRLPDGRPVIHPELLDQERQRMSELLFAQEYHCSFDAGVEGAYYAALLNAAEADARIRNVPWEPAVDVWTWWDLGMGDKTTIWFVQHVHQELRVIDYYENSGHGLTHYAKLLKERPYCYGGHVLPHDVRVRELGTGKSRKEVAESLGLRPITVAPSLSIEDGIEAVRTTIPRCYFDATKCARGLDALRQYRTTRNDVTEIAKPRPVHDWTSHAADAFRYGALTVRRQQPRPRQPVYITSKVLGA